MAEYKSLDSALMEIAAELQPMTVRGLFYQAEVRGLVEKSEKGYELVQRRCLRLRYAGVMPFDWIADESRLVRRVDRYDSVGDFQRQIANRYHRNYWFANPERVEIWCEKDALSGVIADTVCVEWGVDLYIQKGFSSATYIYQAALNMADVGKPTHIYVLSDFDPSGKASLAAIEPGLRRHLPDDFELHVHDLAVTPDQIERWNLPDRPTKTTDSRAAKFIEKFGDRGVELDAIRPDTLRSLVGHAIRQRWHHEKTMEQLKAEEREERAGLRKIRFRES
ncbi:MAG: hypothetical protein U0790_12220 [Isosphaeraceae bacterium]